MTFTQLRTFALVAELGSLRAAAAALGVSEPAVSAAVAALRTDLGDPLFRRTGSGIELTPGGRALAARARELVRLADRTRREVGARDVGRPAPGAGHGGVRRARGRRGGRGLHPAGARGPPSTSPSAPPSARPARSPRTSPTSCWASGRLPPPGRLLDAVPFLRYERVVVAAPGHPLAGAAGCRPADLGGLRG